MVSNDIGRAGLERVYTRGLLLAFLVGLYYLSYRYPFRINSSITSPTYGDTGTALQLGKYLILFVIAGGVMTLTAIAWSRREAVVEKSYPIVTTAMLIFALLALAKGAALRYPDLAALGFVFVVGFCFATASPRWAVDADALGKTLSFFAVVALIVEAVQVYLFRTQGRLPGLAYEDSVSVRFGSLLDDPNGFAILTALLLPVVWIRWRGRRLVRIALCVGLVVTLLLTQSFTGVVATSGAIGLVLLIRARRNAANSFALMLSGCIAVVGGLVYLNNWPWFRELLLTKSGSISARSTSLEAIPAMSFSDLIGVGSSTTFHESTYVALVYGIGLPLTVLYVGIGIASVARLLRLAESTPGSRSALYWGFAAYQVAYLVGSINMQFSGVYPNNLMYVLGIVLSISAPMAVRPPRVERAKSRRAPSVAMRRLWSPPASPLVVDQEVHELR